MREGTMRMLARMGTITWTGSADSRKQMREYCVVYEKEWRHVFFTEKHQKEVSESH
jgi:hypothetical protein